MKSPSAKWKADERQRHKDAGRVAVTVHVRPEFRELIRALEVELQRCEARAPAPAAGSPAREGSKP